MFVRGVVKDVVSCWLNVVLSKDTAGYFVPPPAGKAIAVHFERFLKDFTFTKLNSLFNRNLEIIETISF